MTGFIWWLINNPAIGVVVGFGFLVALAACCFAAACLVAWAWDRARSWQPRRLADEPVPYWPVETIEAVTSAAACPLCKPIGQPPCTCTSTCGHPDCIGDYTTQGGLSYEQVMYLRALKKELWP